MATEHELRTTEKTPLEMAVETLFKLTPKIGTTETNSGFVLSRKTVINGNGRNREIVTLIEARRGPGDGAVKGETYVFDESGLLRAERVIEIPADILGRPLRRLPLITERSSFETTDDQKRYSSGIVSFVKSLVPRLIAVRPDQLDTDPKEPPVA